MNNALTILLAAAVPCATVPPVVTPPVVAPVTTAPANIQATIAAAKPGDTITLAPGNYDRITIANRNWSSPITIDATQAKLLLSISNSSGINVIGGAFSGALGAGQAGYAISVVKSHHLTFSAPKISNSQRAIVLHQSHHIGITAPDISGMIVDGIDLSSSQFVTIDGARCTAFVTGPAHPDCIQGWSRPGGITSDVKITNSFMDSPVTQGLTFFNHIRNGVDDGGFDRISIDTATLRGNMTNGVAMSFCRACSIKNVTLITIPGSRYKMSVRVSGGSVTQSGNVAK